MVIFPSAPTVPLLMVLMVTGVVVEGTTAKFSVPVMPGPVMKKAKASLNSEQTYSLYSSDANTYRKLTKLLCGTKSNSRIAPSYVVDCASVCNSGIPGPLLLKVAPPLLFGPGATLMCPEVMMTPLGKPIFELTPLNVPTATGFPV